MLIMFFFFFFLWFLSHIRFGRIVSDERIYPNPILVDRIIFSTHTVQTDKITGPVRWKCFNNSDQLVKPPAEPSSETHSRWGAPSVFSSGRLRAPWPIHQPWETCRLFFTPTTIYRLPYHANLVSLCSDHFCAYRKKYPIGIYGSKLKISASESSKRE